MQIASFTKATLEPNRLVIQDSITAKEWEELGRGLKQVEGSVQFWLGDWARFGEKKGFGKYTDGRIYDEMEKITGIPRKTIQEYKSIADRTSSTRVEHLTFTHHREVAGLPEDKQTELLNMAKAENLSSRQLKQEVNKLANNTSFIEEAEVEEIPLTKDEQKDADLKWADEIIKQVNAKPVLIRLKIRQSIKQ